MCCASCECATLELVALQLTHSLTMARWTVVFLDRGSAAVEQMEQERSAGLVLRRGVDRKWVKPASGSPGTLLNRTKNKTKYLIKVGG